MSVHVRHSHHPHHGAWWAWPFKMLFKFLFKGLFHLIGGVLELVLRFTIILLGGVLFFVGLLVSLTIIGAIVGIPLMLVGGWLVVKGIF